MSNGRKEEIMKDFEELTEQIMIAFLAFATDKEDKIRIASNTCFLIKTHLQKK
jgi:uncharacterized protein (DUF433 family)